MGDSKTVLNIIYHGCLVCMAHVAQRSQPVGYKVSVCVSLSCLFVCLVLSCPVCHGCHHRLSLLSFDIGLCLLLSSVIIICHPLLKIIIIICHWRLSSSLLICHRQQSSSSDVVSCRRHHLSPSTVIIINSYQSVIDSGRQQLLTVVHNHQQLLTVVNKCQ